MPRTEGAEEFAIQLGHGDRCAGAPVGSLGHTQRSQFQGSRQEGNAEVATQGLHGAMPSIEYGRAGCERQKCPSQGTLAAGHDCARAEVVHNLIQVADH
jgi:hypothetical protein